MSVFTPIKEDEKQSVVDSSQYIANENEPGEETKPAEPETPEAPAA